ncbi:phosphatidic acid phosphatase type 2/haloperoxidase [Crepidotus variabilis]|uniref:Phosphatidic acid phosphatase type 2/haloperoxidase n=1 Tax=Crepidotus variabilis TaxID=179855 RepID=A0A9P6JV34_9AGAR|nr:phosphatidic acid phosphatase type 2/haloperoxidase [Crepidotus variabilis]
MSYSRLGTPVPGGPPPRMQQNDSFISRISFKPIHAGPQRGAMTAARRNKLFLSYIPDWALTILLAGGFFLLDKVEGYRRSFSLEDTSLRHPFATHERVPNTYLLLIAVVAPLCIMPIVNFITVRSWWDLHNSSLGLILGASLTGAFTQVVKITVGRPRPDIIDRCQPPSGTTDPQYGLSSWTVCTSTDAAILRDGFRSFFSGHSSLSFAGMGFLSFYLAGKLHLFDSRGHAGKAWLALSPFMAAALVAISRSMDYRHHWQDILVGSLVGTLFSYFSYRQYYPSLESPVSHRPYSPRIKREEEATNSGGILPTHHQQYPQHQQSGYANPYGSTTHRRFDSGASYTDSVDDVTMHHGVEGAYEMSAAGKGTVPRPKAGSLEEVWREGSEDDHGGAFKPLKVPSAFTGPQTSTGIRSIPGPSSGGFGSGRERLSNMRGPVTAPPMVGQDATYPPSTIPSEPPSAVEIDLKAPEPAAGYSDPFHISAAEQHDHLT